MGHIDRERQEPRKILQNGLGGKTSWEASEEVFVSLLALTTDSCVSSVFFTCMGIYFFFLPFFVLVTKHD